jgi:hypothetical protein
MLAPVSMHAVLNSLSKPVARSLSLMFCFVRGFPLFDIRLFYWKNPFSKRP